ncbi:hypothetical protein [Lyngbya aestuarii]|uniref:hypothetical protein n=1 Tax=Lyngbya aestuarii TaxID=118322 RepID=UPI00403DE006
MSDSMAFLTGAAFAGVAVLFMIKGGGNLSATNLPPSPQLPISPNSTYDPYNSYLTNPQTPTPASPGSNPYNLEQQRLDTEQLRAMLEQQRNETEKLKFLVQNQQQVIDKLTVRPSDPNTLSPWDQTAPATASVPQPEVEQPDNPLLSGIVWALGGMAITMSGGVVVVGALALFARQQRPPRTTYVVQQPPYNALPPVVPTRRRSEFVHPQYEDRRYEQLDYDR